MAATEVAELTQLLDMEANWKQLKTATKAMMRDIPIPGQLIRGWGDQYLDCLQAHENELLRQAEAEEHDAVLTPAEAADLQQHENRITSPCKTNSTP